MYAVLVFVVQLQSLGGNLSWIRQIEAIRLEQLTELALANLQVSQDAAIELLDGHLFTEQTRPDRDRCRRCAGHLLNQGWLQRWVIAI